VAADDEDSMLSQGDPLPDVKKQVPSVKATAIQADQPQHLPVMPRTNDHQQIKALGVQQLTA